MIWIATILLILLAALADEHKDFEEESGNKSRTWINKWVYSPIQNQLIVNKTKPWYYLGLYKPKYKEAFPYSSTILVAFTDKWHLYKLLFQTCWQTAFVIHLNFALLFVFPNVIPINNGLRVVILVILCKILHGLVFEITKSLRKKIRK